MRLSFYRFSALCILAVSILNSSARAAVVATASPSSGNAPLAVFFDGSGSAATTYQWEFGDGGSSTSATVTHIYTVAGTYTATLVVNGDTANPATLVITVAGIGSGAVTPGMNFRIAPTLASFKINRKVVNSDSFMMRGIFNTVDLPSSLLNLAASIKINGTFVINGIIGTENTIQNPTNSTKPSFFAFINIPDQQFVFQISKANLGAALATSGAVDANVPAFPVTKVPVTVSLTIGAQTYDFTQKFDYTAVAGASAIGKYDLSKRRGDIGEGFFVVSKSSAIEVPNTKSHFFEFDGYLSESAGVLVNIPPKPAQDSTKIYGFWVIKLNEADPISVPLDGRVIQSGNLISYTQADRAAGGVHTVVIDTVKRTFAITTWDIKSNSNVGGTGLPVRGEAFTTFNFALRLDLDQFDSLGNKISTLSVVTATKLSRKTTDDAFWQTGRKKPGQ